MVMKAFCICYCSHVDTHFMQKNHALYTDLDQWRSFTECNSLMQFIQIECKQKSNVVIYYQWTEFQHDRFYCDVLFNCTLWNIFLKNCAIIFLYSFSFCSSHWTFFHSVQKTKSWILPQKELLNTYCKRKCHIIKKRPAKIYNAWNVDNWKWLLVNAHSCTMKDDFSAVQSATEVISSLWCVTTCLNTFEWWH